MPITVQNVKDAAEAYLQGETLTLSQLRNSINKFLYYLGEKALVDDSIAATAYTANTWYTDVLPETMVGEITEININDNENTIYDHAGYKVRGRDIMFADSGTYTIYFQRLPSEIANLSDTLEIHLAYKPALVDFVCSWYRMSDDEGESVDGVRLEQLAMQQINLTYRMLSRSRGTRRWTVVRHA